MSLARSLLARPKILRGPGGFCGLCGGFNLAHEDNTQLELKQSENRSSRPTEYATEGLPSITTSQPSAASLDVDALLKEAAAVLRQQSDTSGHHCDARALALVPFRTLLSEIQLEERLGSGAGGTTWKCRWRTTTVAIKLLVSASVDQLRASTREAVCSRIVSHPCVVQCYAINITRLTEQDMELLTAAASAAAAPHRAAGATLATLQQEQQQQVPPPLLCLGTSPPLALGCGAGALQDSPRPPFPSRPVQPPEPQYAPGWILAEREDGESQGQRREQPWDGEAAAAAATMMGGVAAAVEALADTARRGSGGLVSAAPIAVPDAAALVAGAAASAPPLSPIMGTAPAAGADAADSPELLLLRAAAGAALSDRIERPLTLASGAGNGVEARVDQCSLREQAQASPPQSPAGLCGAAGLRAAAGVAGVGPAVEAAMSARASSMASWSDAEESLLLEFDAGDQAAALREELLRLGAAPGKFLTTIIMEWCDGGTLHDVFTCHATHPGGLGLRRSGLASGHLLRGLGPSTHTPLSPGVGGGAGGDPSLPRSCRVSGQFGSTRRCGGGGAAAGGCASGAGGLSSGSYQLCGPGCLSESVGVASTSGAFIRGVCGNSTGGSAVGGGGGGYGGSTASPLSMPSCSRNSMSAAVSSASPMYGAGSGGAAQSDQQPHVCDAQQDPHQHQRQHPHAARLFGQASWPAPPMPPPLLGAAAPFGSFVVPPHRLGPQHPHPHPHSHPHPHLAPAQHPGCPRQHQVQTHNAAQSPPPDVAGSASASAVSPAAAAAVAAAAPDPAVDGHAAAAGGGGGGACASSPAPSPCLAAGAVSSGRTAVLLRCALEVAQGMSYLHSLNLAHGDLTPKNVLLKSTATSRRGFTCKISDFGLSNPTSTGNCLPTDTSRWGALVYMAPEILTGRGTLKQADVYSFGAVLWHMCNGRPPHQELRPAQVLVGLATGDLQLTWPDWIDPRVARIGKACMDPDPAKRPDFEEIVRMLLEEMKVRSRSARRKAAAAAEGRGRGGASYGGAPAAPAAAAAAATPLEAASWVSCSPSSPFFTSGAGACVGGATAVAAGSAAAGLPCSVARLGACSDGYRRGPPHSAGPLHSLQQQQQQQQQQQAMLPWRGVGGASPAVQSFHPPPSPPMPPPHRQQSQQQGHGHPPPEQSLQQQRTHPPASPAARCCEWQPLPTPAPTPTPDLGAGRGRAAAAASLAATGKSTAAAAAGEAQGGGSGAGSAAASAPAAAAPLPQQQQQQQDP